MTDRSLKHVNIQRLAEMLHVRVGLTHYSAVEFLIALVVMLVVTPFAGTKPVAGRYGGTRNGMAIHWPKWIKARGERQSAVAAASHHRHAATILEAAGLPEPKSVNGTREAISTTTRTHSE